MEPTDMVATLPEKKRHASARRQYYYQKLELLKKDNKYVEAFRLQSDMKTKCKTKAREVQSGAKIRFRKQRKVAGGEKSTDLKPACFIKRLNMNSAVSTTSLKTTYVESRLKEAQEKKEKNYISSGAYSRENKQSSYEDGRIF